jgi:hypothetical protein
VITRSIDHQYTYEGRTYPGVTGILKVLDKSGPLMSWAARQTAEAFVDSMRGEMAGSGREWDAGPLVQLLKNVGAEGVVKAMTSRSAWKNDEAKDLGTEVHDLADRINSGRELPPNLSPAAKARAEHYAEWLLASGWNVKISEAYILSPKGGYGGTLDILARDRDGRAVLADIKTGKGVYRETVLQLAAYGMAELIQPVGAQQAFPMPAVDRYVVLHVTATGVREIEVPIGDADRQAFYACMNLTAWSDAQKGRAL